MENNKKEFLIEEYKKCWEYIEFHYSQRDRSQRFFFTFVIGSGGLVAALLKVKPDLHSNPYFYLSLNMLIIPLFLLGIFCLGQIISLRKTTTRFHKAIVTIRAQFLTENDTKLWIYDHNPKFLNKGFNFYTAVIIMLVNGFIIACCPMTISLYLGGIKIWYVLIAILAWCLATLVQLKRYKSIPKNEDDSYVPLFPRDIIEYDETEQSV
jgi:hypothetical protein